MITPASIYMQSTVHVSIKYAEESGCIYLMVCLSISTAGLAGGGMSVIIVTSIILMVVCVIMKRRQTSKLSKVYQDGDAIAPKYTMGGFVLFTYAD